MTSLIYTIPFSSAVGLLTASLVAWSWRMQSILQWSCSWPVNWLTARRRRQPLRAHVPVTTHSNNHRTPNLTINWLQFTTAKVTEKNMPYKKN